MYATPNGARAGRAARAIGPVGHLDLLDFELSSFDLGNRAGEQSAPRADYGDAFGNYFARPCILLPYPPSAQTIVDHAQAPDRLGDHRPYRRGNLRLGALLRRGCGRSEPIAAKFHM